MKRASLAVTLLVVVGSLFLLSVLSNTLTEYTERPPVPKDQNDPTKRDAYEEPSVLMFKVSPISPRLFWRVSTADYYTGLNWIKTTDDVLVERFPMSENTNATRVFTVEFNSSQREIFLALPPSNSALTKLSLLPIEGSEFYLDNIGDVYKVVRHTQVVDLSLICEVSWRPAEVDDRLVSLEEVPKEIADKYLQLPILPIEIRKLAQDLEDPSYSTFDQILADVQYLRTNFVYDIERSEYLYERIMLGCDVSSYIERGRGICIDAATTLAIILRIQNIPARIAIGYNPEGVEEGSLLYYTTGAHSVTEVYLPPYGWVQFDATPPLEEMPLIEVSPFKRASSPGSRLYYQLSITNRRDSEDIFQVFANSKKQWNITVVPRESRIESLQTVDGLFEVMIPSDAIFSEKEVATITVASLRDPEIAFSAFTITQVEDILLAPTTTKLRDVDESTIRGEPLSIRGTVATIADEPVDNMTVFAILARNREAKEIVIGKRDSEQGDFHIKGVLPRLMEIGDYRVHVISLGTALYAPSTSNYLIRVRAPTNIEFGVEKEFLLGYGAIHGRLSWDNGTGLGNRQISFEITPSITPSEVSSFQNLTSNDGTFRIQTTFENPGVYELKAIFSGNDYVIGCTATRTAKLKRGAPTIELSCQNIAVRGRAFNVTGTIQFEGGGVWGEPVTLAFDNQLLTTIETMNNGSFAYSFLVDFEETLGAHSLTVTLKNGNLSTLHEVTVKSETVLTTGVADVAGGMFVLFSATLSDDHNRPIPRAEITVDSYGLSWETDNSGNLTLLLDTFKLWPESVVLTARFDGSEKYSPATTEKTYILRPLVSLPYLIPLFSPALVVASFLYIKRHARRRVLSRQVSIKAATKGEVAMDEEPGHEAPPQQILRIVFPDIRAALPNVWGIKDEIRIGIIFDKSALLEAQRKEVEVSIDEQDVGPFRFSREGRAVLSHVFLKKGDHRIHAAVPRTAEQQLWNVARELRVVDYQEEIVRLYNDFLKKLAGYGLDMRKEMTARELEKLILATSDLNSRVLCEVTSCFEKAEYSNHPITRNDYETMYLSLRKLDIDVEQKE